MDPTSLPVIEAELARIEEDAQKRRQPHALNRRCGDCTACCTFMVVNELKKPAKTPCPHSTGKACAIYESRPPTCRGWGCEWWLGNLGLTDGQRPDKLGLMFSAHPAVMVVNECWPGAATAKAALRLLNRLKSQMPLFFIPAVGTGFRLGPRDAREEIELAGYAPEQSEGPLGDPADRQPFNFRGQP